MTCCRPTSIRVANQICSLQCECFTSAGTILAGRLSGEYKKRMSLNLLFSGGAMIWLILAVSAVAIVVFIERLLHYHRAQIHSAEFLIGVRNVMKRDNIIEAISI